MNDRETEGGGMTARVMRAGGDGAGAGRAALDPESIPGPGSVQPFPEQGARHNQRIGGKKTYLYGLWSFYLEQGGLNPCKIWGKAGQTEVLPLLVLME